MKIRVNKSVNFSKKTRSLRDIQYLIIHYTGMQSARVSMKRLKSPNSKVSCHYLIDRNGDIFKMIDDANIAWHAGKSKWKKFKDLNSCSIGIELVNRGHKFGYQNYSKSQINSLLKLCKNLKKKYSIKKENFLGHSDIAPLRKNDPGEKFPWEKLSKHNFGKWYKEAKQFKNFKKKLDIDFYSNLKKIGYGYLSKSKNSLKNKRIVKSFQQHYLPNNVTGKIDEKTLKISHFLTN